MKKTLKRVIIVLSMLLVFMVAIVFGKRLLMPITYSNLANQASLSFVLDLLEKTGIPTARIDVFTQQVLFTNDYLKDFPTLQGDFTSKRGTVVSYDENAAFNMFISAKLPEDLNCRIAAWNLVKDNITTTPLHGEIEYSEQNILDYYPHTGFEEDDKSNFWSVFKGIEASGFKTKKGYAKVIQDAWKNRGVSFYEGNVSLISCFSYARDNKWLEAVHTGVMINTDDGIVFIEKFNPKAPFQVSIFASEKALKYYLEQRLLSAFILQPIIMKNDVPL